MSNKYEDDERALAEIKSGDRRLVCKWYEYYHDRFVAFIMKKYKYPPEKAREIYPESFAIMWSQIINEKLKPPLKSSLETYLCTIGKNLYQNRNFTKYHADMELRADLPQRAHKPEVDLDYEKKGQAALVRALLAKLDKGCRELLQKFYMDAYSTEAVAHGLDLSQGTTRKRRFDCLRKLRRLYRNKS